jgi:AraC-like DNA-binding protein
LLFYIASAAANIAEALKLLARYFSIANEAVRFKLVLTSDGEAAEFDFFALPRHGARQNTEFGVALMIKALREAAGRKVSPTRVLFAHSRNSERQQFERFFGCAVEFGAQSDRVFFSKHTLAVPLATEDLYLLETLKPVCAAAARQRNTPKDTIRIAVENEVQKRLPHGKARKQDVARALTMSERTLSRRLADEGTSFDAVLDKVRRSLALQYVNEREISFAQISWLLGYEGSTSFNHAFRRWTGGSPSQARNRMKARPA